MQQPLKVTRVTLAKCFDVHSDTILAWHAEGLDAAIVQRGGPGRPALYDGARALDFFNGHKAKPAPACFTVKTLADLEAATASTTTAPKSAALRTIERLDAERLRDIVSRSKRPRRSKEPV